MAAIITEQFRRFSAKMLLNDVRANNYYMGIGQQKDWPETIDNDNLSAPYPKGTAGDVERAKHHLTGLFRVSTIHSQIVIPVNELDDGLVYKPYDPYDPTCFYTNLETGARPCYAMYEPNMLFICLHKSETADDNFPGMSESNIANQFGLSGLHDYDLPILVDGYTWAFLGTYDQFSLINSLEFVSIGSDITTSETLELNTKAQAFLEVPGDFNNIIFTSILTGVVGNTYQIELVENGALGAGTINYSDVDNVTYRSIQFEFGTGTTASQLINYANTNVVDITTRKVLASSSGGDSGTLASYPPIFLTGGAVSETAIRNATGGGILGFKVIDGGKLYQAPSETFPSDGDITITGINATIYGLDQYGGSRTPLATQVDVVLDTTSLAGGNWDLNENCGSIKEVRLQNSPAGGNISLGWSEARIELDWTQSNPTRVASILVKLAPIDGFGADKLSTLPSWYVGVYADTARATYTPDETDFHQITLLRDPKNADGDSLSRSYVQPLDYFELEGWTTDPQLAPGWQILQNGEKIGVISHIQTVESSASNIALFTPRYYLYRDYQYGFRPMVGSENISFESPDGLTLIQPALPPSFYTVKAKELDGQSIVNEGYSMHTGDIIFEDNRAGIARAEGQNEELKLVIQL